MLNSYKLEQTSIHNDVFMNENIKLEIVWELVMYKNQFANTTFHLLYQHEGYKCDSYIISTKEGLCVNGG